MAGVPRSPMMLVLSPTRELAMQTQVVMEAAGKQCYIRSVCCYGGVPKWEQKKALRWGVEVVVATPGRLKDLVAMGCVSLAGISYLVLDEADRMFDMGFEPQVRSICDHVRPDRQCQLYSATFKKRIGKYIKLGPILSPHFRKYPILSMCPQGQFGPFL